MRRNFYLAIKAIRELNELPVKEQVETLFPESDVKDHIIRKIKSQRLSLLDLYETVDQPHQMMFDTWFNNRMAEIEKSTIPYR